MILAPIEIVGCFMFLCSLLLVGVIYSRVHWLLKALLVCSSLMFSVIMYDGYQKELGYSVAVTPPKMFLFLYGVVDEPAPVRHHQGAIYVWLVDPAGRPEPRAIKLPYSKQSREIVNKALDEVRKGKMVYMGTPAKGKGDTDGDGKNGKGAVKNGSGDSKVPYNLTHILEFKSPPDTMPKKVGDN